MRAALLFGLVIWAAGCSGPPNVALEPIDRPGTRIELKDLKGKVVLLDFWATWCGPCIGNIPHVQQLHDRYAKDGLQIVAVTDEKRETVEAFRKEMTINYPVYLDPSRKAFLSYNVSAIPYAVLIGRDGSVLFEGHPLDAGLASSLKSAMESR